MLSSPAIARRSSMVIARSGPAEMPMFMSTAVALQG
jgi:hypothetical protein